MPRLRGVLEFRGQAASPSYVAQLRDRWPVVLTQLRYRWSVAGSTPGSVACWLYLPQLRDRWSVAAYYYGGSEFQREIILFLRSYIYLHPNRVLEKDGSVLKHN